ncbi:MAG: hypothetical protein HOC23_13030 [Halieaceae bacterium]|nr:hypothetical protein [Halieaceae bacterium]
MPDYSTQKLYDLEPAMPLVLAGYTLLTPNLRLARRIKTVWDQARVNAGDQVWQPIRVMPLELWLEQQWQRAVIMELVPANVIVSTGHALELWYQVVIEQENRSNSYNLLQPGIAASMANKARETLLGWQVNTEDSVIRQEFELATDSATYLKWQALFEQRLAEKALTTRVDAISQLLTCAPLLPKSRVALMDFDDISPLFQSCLDVLCDDIKRPQQRLEPGRRTARAFVDKRSELLAAAHWAKSESDRDPAATIGIIVPDMAADRPVLEYFLRQEFDCLGENYQSLPVNFSAGMPLDKVPLVRDALQLLSLGLGRIALHELIALLQSRFLILADAGTPGLVELITELFDDGLETVAVAELRHRASQIKVGESTGLSLGRHLVSMARMQGLNKVVLPSAWIPIIDDVLALWGWPGSGPLDSLEYQQVETWFDVLDEFSGYDTVCDALSLESALLLLGTCCSRHVFQPQSADSSIQVLGALEGAGLAFDHLWICGMQSSQWPAAASPNPLIPVHLQRQLQMPHATPERQWSFASALMRQYTRNAKLLNASYSQLVDGAPELGSTLLEPFDWIDGENEEQRGPASRHQLHMRGLEFVEDNQAPTVCAEELTALAGGSAVLEDQSSCPFRGFAMRRLKAVPLNRFGVGLSAAERGSLLHNALYILWGTLEGSEALTALDDNELAEHIEAAVLSALRSSTSRGRPPISVASRNLERQRLISLLGEWMALERRRSEFVIHAREETIQLSLEQLKITLRVDRIDRLPDGSLLVIDYKSGRCKLRDWLGQRPARPQLLLYGIAATQPLAGLTYAQVRKRDCQFIGAGKVEAAPGIATDIPKLVGDSMHVEDWDSLTALWREHLTRLASEFIAGNARVDPLTPDSCTYCGLQALCRTGDVALVEAAP